MDNFKISFEVNQNPETVFNAITNVRGWWSAALEGQSTTLGDEFIYRHKDMHYSRHKLTEVVSNKSITWLTTDSSLNFVANKTEWTGTTVVFELTPNSDGKTTMTFTHHGLVPSLQCFEGCSRGWAYYIESLKQLIETGEGNPDN